MIVKPPGLAAALRRLESIRLVLTFGPDTAQAGDLAASAVAASGLDATDPFTSVTLTAAQLAEDPARLLDEVMALSFLGGRKLIRADGLGDSAADAVAALLDAPGDGNLVIATAGDLAKRSRLRVLAEGSAQAIAVACYPDDRSMAAILGQECDRLGLRLDRDGADLLLEAVGTERGILRSELEKLALHAGASGRADREAVIAVCTGVPAGSYDKALRCLFDSDAAGLDGALAALLADGEATVAILRAVQRRTLQLMRARVGIHAGLSASEAVRAVQPPVFWKEQDSVASQARKLSYTRLSGFLAALLDAEIAAKSGAGDDAGRQVLLRLADAR